jgi:acyl carrier protein
MVLDLGPDAFGDDDALSALGIDSMTAIEVKHRIDQALRVDLPMLDLLQGTTIDALAGQTLSLIDVGGSAAAPEPGDGGTLDEAELEKLLRNASEDELEQLLADLERDLPEHRSVEQ